MNPRDEKILLLIRKKQNQDYGNLVPFCIIHKAFLWIDPTELTIDLLKLDEDNYLWKIEDPVSHRGWWYGLTSQGKRECERIKHDNLENRKNRNIQLVSTIVGAIIGFLLNEFFSLL